ncbi:MAG: TetR/AcrR family transcriptional regulator [Paludibacter sp.]|nr:TetR/AcrR family transcriptional regulator [Paludibacter sp.]
MDLQKEQIIQTSDNLFKTNGIRNISIDQICSDLRISKKTFYAHFMQKEDLVDAVVTYNKQQTLNKFSKNLKNKNAIDGLIFIVREIKKNADCESHAMWFDIEKYYPRLFEKHQNEQKVTIKNGFENNLHQGITEGYYRKDLDIELTSIFHAIQIKNTFDLMEQSSIKFTKKRLLDFFIDLMMHLIANEKGLKYLEEHYFKDEKTEKVTT